MNLAQLLRDELAERARAYAVANRLAHSESYGQMASVCFAPEGQSVHGNFVKGSYAAIQADRGWQRRLAKVHTGGRRCLPQTERGRWRELDSCMSSDALLMNVFCYPGVMRRKRVRDMLGVEAGCRPQFGFPARVPIARNGCDRTEIDMRLGSLLVEAKLTETDFQSAPKARLGAYRDFAEVFDCDDLAQGGERIVSYQIVRNLLAAYAHHGSFCLLVDARRTDLVERFYAVLKCVKPLELRTTSRVLTWQELAVALPQALRKFLGLKYGI